MTEEPKTPAWGTLGLLLGAPIAALGYMLLRDRESKDQRSTRFDFTMAAVDGFVLHMWAVHQWKFAFAKDALAYAEVHADEALRYLPGPKLKIPPPPVQILHDGSWLMDTDEAKATIHQHLINIADYVAPEREKTSADRKLLNELVDLLGERMHERGHTDATVVDVLKRILRERDELMASNPDLDRPKGASKEKLP